jgi:hypothetical protein
VAGLVVANLRRTIDNIYYGQAILCILVFAVALLRHYSLTPAFVTGIEMWQAWASLGISCILLRFGDAIVLTGLAAWQGARRLAGYSFNPIQRGTFWRIAGLTAAAAGYALAFIAPFFFILMIDQFNYIATKSP